MLIESVFSLNQAAYEQVKEARNGCVDLFKEFTRIMVENAAQMGTFVVTRRKVGNPILVVLFLITCQASPRNSTKHL